MQVLLKPGESYSIHVDIKTSDKNVTRISISSLISPGNAKVSFVVTACLQAHQPYIFLCAAQATSYVSNLLYIDDNPVCSILTCNYTHPIYSVMSDLQKCLCQT